MKKNSIYNHTISIKHPFTIQLRNEHSTYRISNLNNDFNIHRRTLQKFYQIKQRFFTRFCAFGVFTSIVIIIGALTVYYTSPKDTNKTCQLIFKPTFDHQTSFDSRPQQVAVGDFNNDNYLDLVVANSGTDNIGIFIGFGNGTFATQLTYSTGLGSSPCSVVVGDYNNDGQSDIAVANYGNNNIGVFLSYGNGKFADQKISSLGSSHPLSLAIGYFNNDNYTDIVVANYGTSNIAILSGFGNGFFRLEAIYDMGYDSIPYSISIADLNNDHYLDIAIVNYGTSNLVILLANGNGTFANYQYSTGNNAQPSSIAIGDFNNDNYFDIAVANSNQENMCIFLGYGNGTFTKIMIYFIGPNSRPQFIVTGHFDTDNKLDLVVTDSGNSNMLLFKGDGNGTFSLITTRSTGYSSDSSSMAIADFDGDKKLDIAVSNNGTNNILVFSLLTVYPNTSQTTYSTGENSAPNSVATADFNHDNYLDIAVASINSNTVSIFLGCGNGTFIALAAYYTGADTNPFSVAIGDFNNDNNNDIVVTLLLADLVGFLLGNGDGTFQIAYGYPTALLSYPDWVAVGYFNSDQNIDIVTANYYDSNVNVFLLSGNEQYLSMTAYSTGDNSFPSSIAVGDLNNDNITDFAVANSYGSTISIHLGYGDGSFNTAIIISTGDDYPNCITIGDLNNDRILDIVFTNDLTSNLGILLGYGNATFGQINMYLTGYGSYPTSVALGNFNNDTFLDIAVTNGWGFNIGIFLGYGNGVFAPQQTFSTGPASFPDTIAFGDFNNDNQSDIVVGNSFTSNIGVFLVYYVTDFISEASFSTGSSPHPYSLAVGHFNNNSWLDIAVADSGNDNLQILLDYNEGAFMNTLTYSTNSNSHPQYVMVADFNKDNQLDIAITNNWNDSISVFSGLGNGTFNTAIVYSTGSGSFPSSMAAGDFNNDSWIDIAVTNQATNNVGIFLGFNHPMFSSYNINFTRILSIPVYVVTADFNNDSCWDIAVVNIVNMDSSQIGILLGYCNGTFSEPVLYLVNGGANLTVIAVGDFNNDHRPDIAVTNANDHSISIFLGYGDGTFAEQILYSTNPFAPYSIAVGDFNNDSRLDIVVAYPYDNRIGISFGFGNGSFGEQIVYWMPAGSAPTCVAVDDFSNDNILDIVVANGLGNNIGILLGYGDGTFSNVTTYSTGNRSDPVSIAIGDINKDGWMDIGVANLQALNIGIFFGYSNGTFSPQKTYSFDNILSLNSIAFGEINNDTILDIIVTAYTSDDSYIGIFYGLIDGNYAALQTYSTGASSYPVSVAICDFNNDSRVDLVVANYNTDNIGIMLQGNTSPYGTQTIFSTGNNSQPNSVAVGDFNNDNLLDIAVANTGTNNIGILLGYGNGSFADQKTYSTGDDSGPTSIIVSDFNNDRQLDFAVTNSDSNNIGIYLGHVNGSFIVTAIYSTGQSSVPSSIAVADFNKDRHLDLVVTNWGTDTFLIFFGLGNGSFLSPISYSLGYGARPQFVTIGDFNNDGWMDLAVANYGTNYVDIFLQTC